MRLSLIFSTVMLFFSCSKEESFSMDTSARFVRRAYYIANAGNDANDGKSPLSALKTITALNKLRINPGDSILFAGGETFVGNLDLGSKSGNELSYTYVGSYGKEKAIIDAGTSGSGIIARNTHHIIVKDLIIKGAGNKQNAANGVFFYADIPSKLKNVELRNLEVYGFTGRGVYFNIPWKDEVTNPGGQLPTPGSAEAGFENVIMEGIVAHDNGMAGIEVGGYWSGNLKKITHRNITVRGSKAYNNTGVASFRTNHSGSGILIAGTDGALIEYCEAYNNGSENGFETAGPIGIWIAESRNGLIQYCESYRNKGGLGPDGGGFDIDGGSANCIIQYCYSHENSGAGFAVYEWGSENPMYNITIRHNISENDGLDKDYGGIALWSMKNIDNINIHNNTVYVNSKAVSASTHMNAIRLLDEQQFTNLRVFNNIFLAEGPDARILRGVISVGSWENNIYWVKDGAQVDGFSYGRFVDPKLTAPGRTGVTDPNTRISANTLGFTPASGSPAINTGVTLGLPMPIKDFKGSPFPSGGAPDVGAIEF